ncbi:mitogen-activated protein kinase kinase kinase [Vigna unguiculata]|uniref:Mitogen-activated protein kinase kinase kinase n=1 Tax=Vigna unguiculata TaxID=3917 RepID=A0A4D6MWP5_VIGUN|nr:mitogen-activated protein kinase kinase kinase [Vigna unguiculata]QCE05509.1 mitogen-activated protein kinase kinase kinase [Vigna unguiculata]
MGEWKSLGVLGEGSYAIVYLAVVISQKKHTSNVVAVKSSKPCCYVSLQKEHRILELFKGCEEILQCYFYQDTIENGCRTYNLFMEYTPCGTLDDLIKKGSLSEKEVIMYTRMILKGLRSIHKEGIIHCDLKPANILLFPSSDDNAKYQLKIADFGLSNTIGDANVGLGEIMFRGTPIYMSPESIIGLMGTTLDIWSLGCIVIEMMTGFPPWTNIQSIEELKWKLGILEEVPKIPDELNWDCKNFLSKCFAKDPRERWSAPMLLDHPFIQKEYPTSSMFNPSSFFSYDIVSYVSH